MLFRSRCGEETYFTLDASQAGSGPAQVSMHSPEADVPVTVQPVGAGIYKASYVARIPGNYQLNVLWGGRSVEQIQNVIPTGFVVIKIRLI